MAAIMLAPARGEFWEERALAALGLTDGKARSTARATATAKEEADPCGMTARKAKAKANTGVSPLRCASVEMTEFLAGEKARYSGRENQDDG
jgi:hypothetical protein